MDANECNRTYELLCAVLIKRPRESLHDAAQRYLRNGRSKVRKQVARAILDIGDKRGEAAWDAMADAADIVRPHLVH